MKGSLSKTDTAPSLALSAGGRRLCFDYGSLHQSLSWAIVGGGWRPALGTIWVEVRDHELCPPVNPIDYLKAQLASEAEGPRIGLLTSARLLDFADVRLEFGDHWARTVVTAGLGNALRVGDPPGPSGRIGTINIACQFSHALSLEASIEGMALISEAKTAAMLACRFPSKVSEEPATGTGTDCQVLSSPIGALPLSYAGKHTTAGHLIGASAYEACHRAIQRWFDRKGVRLGHSGKGEQGDR